MSDRRDNLRPLLLLLSACAQRPEGGQTPMDSQASLLLCRAACGGARPPACEGQKVEDCVDSCVGVVSGSGLSCADCIASSPWRSGDGFCSLSFRSPVSTECSQSCGTAASIRPESSMDEFCGAVCLVPPYPNCESADVDGCKRACERRIAGTPPECQVCLNRKFDPSRDNAWLWNDTTCDGTKCRACEGRGHEVACFVMPSM